MTFIDPLVPELRRFIPVLVVAVNGLVVLVVIRWLWLGKKVSAFFDHKIVPQVLMIIFWNIGLILIILALPVSFSTPDFSAPAATPGGCRREDGRGNCVRQGGSGGSGDHEAEG